MNEILGMFRRANEVDLAALAVKMGLEINTYLKPVRIKCPFHEDGGDFNLTVHTTGAKWSTPHVHCYACDYSGSAVDFVRDHLRVSDREAVSYILERELPTVEYRPQVEYATRDMTTAFANASLRLFGVQGEAARAYLELRGLGPDVWHSHMLGLWADDATMWSGRITIPHLRLPGEPIFAGKGRAMDGRDPKYLATKGARQGLYLGERALVDDDSPVVLCEGELDTLSMIAALRGVFPVCGAPGVNNFSDAELFTGRVVYLMLDGDEAGQRALHGYERRGVWVKGYMERLAEVGAYPVPVTPQLGDVNDMLVAHGPDGLGEWFMEETERRLMLV